MRIFTERENELFELIEPYIITQDDLSSKLSETAPETIRRAYKEFLRISKEKDDEYAALM